MQILYLLSEKLNIFHQFILANLMESTTILSNTLPCTCTVQETIIYTVVFTVIIILLKLQFRGKKFTIPNVDLSGKFAVVTGGNSGIGAETVKQLAKLGCEVVIGARSKQTAEQLIKQIRKDNLNAKVQYIALDLASRASIQAFAQNLSFSRIDYLVNNAGLMAIPQRKTTKEGFEMQWGVNHLGHFYLTYLLWAKIAASSFFRVINVSSLAHQKTFFGFGEQPKPDWQNINFEKDYEANISYARSKLYNVLFTKALSAKIGERRGLIVSLRPGVVRTALMRQMEQNGWKGQLIKISLLILYPIWWLVSKSPSQGNQTTMYALLSKEIQNGCYYANCSLSKPSSQVTKENWDRLWMISQAKLGVKFDV